MLQGGFLAISTQGSLSNLFNDGHFDRCEVIIVLFAFLLTFYLSIFFMSCWPSVCGNCLFSSYAPVLIGLFGFYVIELYEL